MSRIRTIKPELFKHWELYEAELETGLPLRVAFMGLFTAADREGRFKWIPQQLKIDCLPYDDCDFSRVLHALTTRGFIEKYTVNGRDYGHILSWKRHQVINNRERESELPEPSKHEGLTREPRVDDACPTCAKGKGREGKGREQERYTHTQRVPDESYPQVAASEPAPRPEPPPPPDPVPPIAASAELLPRAGPDLIEMTPSWQPAPDTLTRMTLGLGINPGQVLESLIDFRLHHCGSGRRETSEGWTGRLIRWARQDQHKPSNVKRFPETGGGYGKSERHHGQRPDNSAPGQVRAAIREKHGDIFKGAKAAF